MPRLSTIALPLILLLGGILQSCAHIVKPTGGPKDSEGPRVIGAIPPPRVLNYTGDQVVIYFDEFLKPGSYSKEVFLSPVPQVEPTITVKNRKLTIQFNSPLRDSTTYVITLGTGIKDFNEGNKMDKSFTYAFSTGDQLDTLQIRGKVINSFEGAGEPEMKILAFLADEIEGNDIFDKRPVYATETDKEGEFTIEYLREAAYKIYAVRDDDNSYSLSTDRERLGLAVDPVVDLGDTAQRNVNLELYSFLEDKTAPGVRSVRWSNDQTIHVEFTEKIRAKFDSISLNINMLDSISGESRPVKLSQFKYKDTQNLFFKSPFPRTADYKVNFSNVMDTLGTYSDTTVNLFYDQMARDDLGKLFESPIIKPAINQLVVYSYFPLPRQLDTSQVYITDTTGTHLPLFIKEQGYKMTIKPDTARIVAGMPYALHLDSTIAMSDSQRTDTNLVFNFLFTDPAEYGSLSGEIVRDSLNPNTPYVMLLMSRGKKGLEVVERIKGPGPFSFPHLLAGSYTIKLIKDDDGNGYLSPGSLNPYFLPEKVIIDPEPVKVKANWAVEGYNVFPYEVKASKSGKMGRGEDGNTGEDQPDEDDERDEDDE